MGLVELELKAFVPWELRAADICTMMFGAQNCIVLAIKVRLQKTPKDFHGDHTSTCQVGAPDNGRQLTTKDSFVRDVAHELTERALGLTRSGCPHYRGLALVFLSCSHPGSQKEHMDRRSGFGGW